MNMKQVSSDWKRSMQVISAVPFSEEQKVRLTEILREKLPEMEYEYEYVVDENLLGGVCLKTKSFVLDATYRRHLLELYSTVFQNRDR